MIAVLTGDIINSRKLNSNEWLPVLKNYFKELAKENIRWEIYRGDSFQLELPVQQALSTAVKLKALIKSKGNIDVRIAIGIGDKNYHAKNVTESNGTAYINSGDAFEKIKNTTLILKSTSHEFDEYFTPILKLLSFVCDNWKPVSAETIFMALKYKDLTQKNLSVKLKRDASTVNKALKRAAYYEIIGILELYSNKVKCMN